MSPPRRRPLATLALTAGLALGLGAPAGPGGTWGTARAAAYDPALTWRSIETEHFRITFHGGLEQLAEESAVALEDAWDTLTAELQTAPKRRIEVVLVDRTDSANGYAQTVPVNTIVMYVTAPTEDSNLSLYEDWNETILTHELTHILHLDTVEGLPGAVRAVLGRVISVHRVSPGWVVEGFATFQETRQSNAGRGRSSMAHMIKRMAVLEDGFPPLGNMDGWISDMPGGNLRYLFGQDFIQFVSDRTGQDAWTDWVHVYGRGIPYLLPGKRVFGQRLVPLYKQWRQDMTERYQRQAEHLRVQGLTPTRRLSDADDRCYGPAWSPDGSRIVWTCTDPKRGTDTWVADRRGEQAEVVLDGRGATSFSWRPDSQAFAFSSSRVVNRYNVWQDVNLHTLGGSTETVTRGQRARDPAISPDGQTMLVITNEAQDNQLARLTVDRRLQELTDHRDHTQLSSPRFSPDGRTVALSAWKDGHRDIWLYRPDGQPLRRVTADDASDIDPAWSADGRTLYFSSDRSGVYNIYALDLETERLWQVTNVLGGAFGPAPHPDGHALVFEDFHHTGNQIAWLDLDRSTWWDRGTLPRPVEHGPALATALPAEGDVWVAQQRYLAEKARAAFEQAQPEATQEEEATERKGRQARRRRAQADGGGEGATPWTGEVARYPGLDGLGGPFLHARRWPGPWGLPGEQAPGLEDAPDSAPDEQRALVVDTEAPEEQDFAFSWPVKRYSPWGSLLPPRYVLPTISSTTFGYQGVLSTSGADTLRRWLYSGYLAYRTDASYLGWGASLAWNRYTPIVTAGAYSYVTPYSDVYRETGSPQGGGASIPSVESTNQRYWDQRIRGYAQVTWPIDEYRSFFARWAGTARQPMDPLPADAYRPFLPTRGFISSVGGGWRYARGRSYDKSISPEDARIVSLVADLSSPWIGAFVLDDQDQWVGFTQLQVTAEWREYTSLPWAGNHVLATKLAGGLSAGDENRYGSFRLGGSFGESAYYTLPDEWRALRGFPTAVVYGDSYYLGSAEYRLPIVHVDRGVGTLPFFGRYLSASAFVDAGNAFDELSEPALTGVRVGTGAELIGTAIIGWGIPVTLRVGYGFGVVGDGAIAPGSLEGLYWWFGSSF